jgi:hypothetical protein
VNRILRRLLVSICSYALLESGAEKNFQHIKTALSEVISEGEIHSNAIRECLAARDRYLKFKDNDEYDMHMKAGLVFNVDNTSKMLAQLEVQTDILFVIGLTAILEYVTAEIMVSCPAINLESDTIVTVDVVNTSIKSDKELFDLLGDYAKAENDILEKERATQSSSAGKIVTDLKKDKSWKKNAPVATEEELNTLEELIKTKLPVQLRKFFLAQNGNDVFAVNSIQTISSEFETHNQYGGLLSILEFVPLANRGNNQFDCLDSFSGCVVRTTIPVGSGSSAYPVVAKSFAEYCKKCAVSNQPALEALTLGNVNEIAAQVCDLFKDASGQ